MNAVPCDCWLYVIAGGRPAAGYFFLRRQEKVTKKKATPVCRAAFFLQDRLRTLDSLQIAGLRNSYDPLRGHVLKQSSPNYTAIC
jgi:hypothetical protein